MKGPRWTLPREFPIGKTLALLFVLWIAAVAPHGAEGQDYAIGADVSFLGQCEKDGAVFKQNGKPVDVLDLLREHHYNWVRLRIFHNPEASADKLPNDLAYSLALAKRAKADGFRILLDFHYSDSWADPGKQPVPEAWSKLNHQQLTRALFRYTRDTMAAFRRQDVLPEMVQVGNEVTNGMLWPDGRLPDQWDHFADLLKAGIRGVSVGSGSGSRPRIMIHIERSGDYDAAVRFLDQLNAHGVPYDVLGLSYYPIWHGDIASMRTNLRKLALRYRKPIIVVETAFNWRPGSRPEKKPDFPESPKGQLAFLRAVDAAMRAVPDGLGQGVFWWEPAAEGDLRSRSFFDSDGNVLPVITAFDAAAAR
jgi:arabinogalactan endo-1,4-beta-galactosidase